MYFIIALLNFNVLRNHRILSKKMKPCCVLGECNVGDYLGFSTFHSVAINYQPL